MVNEGTSYGEKYELNENHTHFILIRDKQKSGNAADAMVMKFAELLTKESIVSPKTKCEIIL